ncbi:MAG: hypothetical protein JWN25_1833 [Verrucomicrobiales bacterium]|nr:hypothetical protein [Verrucomicrobiales bacterium]
MKDLFGKKLVVGLVSSLTLALSVHAGLQDKNLDIYWIDSEGGGSTLVVTPAGESILIDTGNPGGRDSGRIANCATNVAGLNHIDHLIMTHFHIDHFGGAAELSKLLPIHNTWDNGLPEGNPDGNKQDTTWFKTIQPYREMRTDRHTVEAGHVFKLRQVMNLPPLMVRVMAANQVIYHAAKDYQVTNYVCKNGIVKPTDTSDNKNSVATLFQFGSFRFFDGGDMTWNTEAKMICPHDSIGTVDIFQVNHHGLDISNNPLLLNSLNPTVTVMNNGPTKGTAPDTMATLRSLPLLKAMYQLHKNIRKGDWESNTEDEFIANAPKDQKNDEGNYIKCSVDSSGNSYTIIIPATGHKQSFDTRAK